MYSQHFKSLKRVCGLELDLSQVKNGLGSFNLGIS